MRHSTIKVTVTLLEAVVFVVDCFVEVDFAVFVVERLVDVVVEAVRLVDVRATRLDVG